MIVAFLVESTKATTTVMRTQQVLGDMLSTVVAAHHIAATDIATDTFPQPGRGSGRQWTENTCENIFAAAERDGLRFVGPALSDYSVGPDAGHYVALYIWPDTNFHWARMDFNGTYTDIERVGQQASRRWSHKPGGTEVQIVDDDGNCIGNVAPCVVPQNANLSPWSVFCGFMTAVPSKLRIA